MKIALLHYHLRQGGVTKVMETQARALQTLGHSVCLVAGDGTSEMPHRIVPALDYQKESALSGKDLFRQVQEALDWLPDLWIIHNPTLGKNILFPSFISVLAEQGTPILLQVHDFAEDGRPANYHLIKEPHLYPLAEHIHYAFINSRDRDLLIKAGLPKERTHLLPNAVNPPHRTRRSPTEQALILYPVRGIRRKNLGELCLLAKHAPAGARFAIALAPENPAWKPGHDRWERLAQEMGLPITFNVTDRIAPHPGAETHFSSWLSHATHIATTSVAEGFGLTFLEPAFLDLPLLGRDLPEITQDFTSNGLQLGCLYDRIPVPASHLKIETLRTELAQVYQSYGKHLTEDLVQETYEAMTTQGTVDFGTVDFGNLPEQTQEDILMGPELPEVRTWLVQALAQQSTSAAPQNLTPWSPDRYALKMKFILEQFTKRGTVSWLPKEQVLAQFFSPARFHFLRT